MSEDQAVYFCAEADKKLSPGLFGKVFGSKTGRFEDAAALYVKAGNIYRTNNKGMHAGECYGKAAQCLSKIGNQHEAAQQFVEAARCSKTSNFEQSIAHFREAVHIFCELGRFSPAAKHMKTIAELYDDNSVFEEAVEAYQTAANYFETNDAQSSANQCLGKIALISGNLERYDQAIPIFEKLGFDALEKDILKMSAKGHFLHALFCMLAKDDTVLAQNKLDEYISRDYSFENSRECRLIKEILQALDDCDVEQFTQVIYDYDSMTKLDPWKTQILLKVKKAMKSELEGDADLL